MMDLLTYNKYSKDPKIVGNRIDKSLLVVYTVNPELLLQPIVAFPDLVKRLIIDCDSYCDHFGNGEDDDLWTTPFDDNKYTDVLCQDIVNFCNLEYLQARGLKLNMKLWAEFAHNSKSLKEIHFSNMWWDSCWFQFDEETLGKVFKIPTLEKVYIWGLELPFFPSGPSNLQDLHIALVLMNENVIETNNLISSYTRNLCTHTNLKRLCIELFELLFNDPRSLLNVAKNCINLEEVELGRGRGDGSHQKTFCTDVIEALLQLPKLKKLSIFDTINNQLVKNKDLVFESIERLEIRCRENLTVETMTSLMKQCPNLKSCIRNKEELIPQPLTIDFVLPNTLVDFVTKSNMVANLF